MHVVFIGHDTNLQTCLAEHAPNSMSASPNPAHLIKILMYILLKMILLCVSSVFTLLGKRSDMCFHWSRRPVHDEEDNYTEVSYRESILC